MRASRVDDDQTRLAAAGAFGRWLSQERELRGLDRQEVARLTRLGSAVIDALESGDPDRMPPQAYVLGYLRSYAGVVGLDADDVVLRWQEVMRPEEGRRPARRRIPVRAVLGAAVVVALVGLLAVALFGGPRQRTLLKLDRPRAVERAPYAADPRGR